jgi:hypothetical protein
MVNAEITFEIVLNFFKRYFPEVALAINLSRRNPYRKKEKFSPTFKK